MIEIPDSLHSVFSATLHEQNGTYVVEVPSGEIDHEAVTLGEAYRVAIFASATTGGHPDEASQRPAQGDRQRGPPEPPVDEGEIRDVTIETIGDKGDGIAKVERGYVVIVPNAQPGDEPVVKIEEVRQNVAFASVVKSDPRTL